MLFFAFTFLVAFLDNADKRRRNDTCGYGDHADADHADDAAEDFAQGGDGVNIAVTRGGECHDRPPKSVTDIFENFGLCAPLDVVHQDCREADHNEACGVGCAEFGFDRNQRLTNDAECFGMAYELENDEDIRQNDEVNGGAVPKDVGQHAGQYGYEIDKSVERKDVFSACFPALEIWM